VALTQQELEGRLWAAANSLRGPVDPSDFKAYIFPLLFYKRVMKPAAAAMTTTGMASQRPQLTSIWRISRRDLTRNTRSSVSGGVASRTTPSAQRLASS
jgi:hypothetical protein